jgi:transglutaminase-like putative cysteine protease
VYLILGLLFVGLISGLAHPAGAGQEPPHPPRNFQVTVVESQAVTLTWINDRPNEPPDAYVIEGGFAAGETWATASIPGTATSATFVLPNGVYFARLRAVHDGVPTEASNEVEVIVGPLRRPSAPEDVAALALRSDVALTWRNSYEGGAPAEILLDVTGAIQETFVVPATGQVTYSGVPNGTYTITLRARNVAGVSDPSQPVTLALPGASIQVVQAPPQTSDAPRLPVRHEDFTTPRLAEFAAREALGDVVQGVSSEFEGLLRLKDWVAAQWAYGIPDPYPPWDAITILDMIRAGETGGFCGQFSQVFLQTLATFGVPARYVEVGPADNPYNHFTTEVWSNDFNKWVLMDATFNNHFELGGVPQSALEVHDAFVLGYDSNLALVLGSMQVGNPDPRYFPHRTAEIYYYTRYHLNANHVTAPSEPPFDRYSDMVEWLDDHTVPWEISTVASEFPHERLTRFATGDRALMEWRPNQIWITARRTGSMEFALDLSHTVLQPLRAEYRVVDEAGVAGPWQHHASSVITWTIGPRDRRLEVRGVNVRGIAGPVSAVAVVP